MSAAAHEALEKTRRYEELKSYLDFKSIENARRTGAAVEAGTELAAAIVRAASKHDSAGPSLPQRVAARFRKSKRGPKPEEHARKKLAQLEDLMYSINPGAMN